MIFIRGKIKINKEEYLDYLQRKTNIPKSMIIKYISMVGTNEENILNYARNSSNAIVRKDNNFNVDYTAVMINQKDDEIKCWKDLCEAYKKQSHNFIDNELKTKANQNQKAIEELKKIQNLFYGTQIQLYVENRIKELESNNE